MALQELLGPSPGPGRGLGHVEHGRLPVVEGVPGVLLDVDLHVVTPGGRLFHPRDLVARNVGITPAEVELQRAADQVQGLEAVRHAGAVERDHGRHVGLGREEVGDGPAQAEPDDADAALDLGQRSQVIKGGPRVGHSQFGVEMRGQLQ